MGSAAFYTRGNRLIPNLFEVNRLSKFFPVYGGAFLKKIGEVRAVDHISFQVKKGEILGLVGESGCGKSTVGRLLLRLIEPTAGTILFEGNDLLALPPADLLRMRKEIQMVFQDPFSSLNPRVSVGQTIADPLQALKLADRRGIKKRVREMMTIVGLDPSLGKKYPHEFSGRDRQRIGIATALAVNPKFIFFDEPVSALDVSAQAQILNLIRYVRDELQITVLIVAHNLSVVEYVSDRVAVMYLGKIVELAPTDILYQTPGHPYTQALMSAIQAIDPEEARKRREIVLRGEIPSPLKAPSGCKFHTRCQSLLGDVCAEEDPPLQDLGDGHFVACHRDSLSAGRVKNEK
ncbi:MAG: ATP-binding cassette domain-containing protein [Deltaproteobacteria bacterium]|nr:ATP-binding cassette domain-containing protein [Deltaproteobacteria bacterium]